jgi:hypothetical protein
LDDHKAGLLRRGRGCGIVGAVSAFPFHPDAGYPPGVFTSGAHGTPPAVILIIIVLISIVFAPGLRSSLLPAGAAHGANNVRVCFRAWRSDGRPGFLQAKPLPRMFAGRCEGGNHFVGLELFERPTFGFDLQQLIGNVNAVLVGEDVGVGFVKAVQCTLDVDTLYWVVVAHEKCPLLARLTDAVVNGFESCRGACYDISPQRFGAPFEHWFPQDTNFEILLASGHLLANALVIVLVAAVQDVRGSLALFCFKHLQFGTLRAHAIVDACDRLTLCGHCGRAGGMLAGSGFALRMERAQLGGVRYCGGQEFFAPARTGGVKIPSRICW